MDPARGYQVIDSLLGYAARLAIDLDNQSLGHGVIDLARSARREIEAIGIKGGAKKIPHNSHEGMLLYRLLPELATRLMAQDGITMMRLADEAPGAEVASVNAAQLRFMIANCMEHSALDLIAEKVRDRFDPSYENTSTFFACEALDRNPLMGNLVEIATTRLSPPAPESRDYFARLFNLTHLHDDRERRRTWVPYFAKIDEEGPSYGEELSC